MQAFPIVYPNSILQPRPSNIPYTIISDTRDENGTGRLIYKEFPRGLDFYKEIDARYLNGKFHGECAITMHTIGKETYFNGVCRVPTMFNNGEWIHSQE